MFFYYSKSYLEIPDIYIPYIININKNLDFFEKLWFEFNVNNYIIYLWIHWTYIFDYEFLNNLFDLILFFINKYDIEKIYQFKICEYEIDRSQIKPIYCISDQAHKIIGGVF